MPLALCFGPGVVFDMMHKQQGEEIQVEDREASLAATGAQLEAGCIALIRTGRDRYQGTRQY